MVPVVSAAVGGLIAETEIKAAIDRIPGGIWRGPPVKEVEFRGAARGAGSTRKLTNPGVISSLGNTKKVHWTYVGWLPSNDVVPWLHRLREVVAQLGFTRLRAAVLMSTGDLEGRRPKLPRVRICLGFQRSRKPWGRPSSFIQLRTHRAMAEARRSAC